MKFRRKAKMGKKFRRGFTAGAFDLFHIGHLNLLRRCKESCEYLIAGVLTDEYILFTKGKNPYIPLAERLEIVKSIRYVDEAVIVDFHNTLKADAWRLYKFDCCYSGNDHEHEELWQNDKKKLEGFGAKMIFLPYTMSTSSTKIKSLIEQGMI